VAIDDRPVNQKTIFVTIPSYNDVSLLRTLDRALEKARYPENIYFCIGLQYSEELMPDLSKYKDNPNFIFLTYDVDKRPGVYWIRREMAEKHSDQDYFLMIDSHMNFVENWDVRLINDYESLVRHHGTRTILSKPTMSEVGHTFDNGHIHDICRWKADFSFDPNSIERTILPWVDMVPWDGTRFIKHLLSCSHFFFTNKLWLEEVGFFNTIRSYSEEMTIAVSSFLSGWDFYSMPEFIHIGHDDDETSKRIYGGMYTLAQGKRYQAIFENDELKKEIDSFCLLDNSNIFKVRNQARSIDDFYIEAGDEISDARKQLLINLSLNQFQA
jgi:hypothetical protein